MSNGEEDAGGVRDTTREFLRSFTVVDYDSEDEFDELSPIPETPADAIDGDSPGNRLDLGEQIIPFKSIFEPAGAYASTKTNFWLPKQPVHVSVDEFERQDLKVLNPNLYKIKVKHGEHDWIVHRRYKHFRQLHDALALFRAKYRLRIPRTEGGKERQKTLKKEWQKQDSVRLPLRPDALIKEEDVPHRMQQLEKYLQNLLLCKSYRNHPETLKFFEVSHLSFVARLGPKSKEGMVKKCSGGRRISIGCCGCLQKVHFAGTWNKRWLVLKDTCLAYIRPEDGVISDVMLMDGEFKVECGMSATGAKHGVLISNLNRNLLVKCWTSRKAREWADAIESAAKKHANDFTQTNRFHSFAPPRDESYARWFVDTKGYFEAVAEAMEKAKEEIYITDWWLSPEIYMKRPMVDGDHWRLDVILERKAKEGVKVFILLYKEIEAALMINSYYSKRMLMGRHENIKVLRHPDHIPGKGILLWAHHEKLVAIDQQIAFVGGIDLCYGRWDDSNHRLTDLGSIVLNSPPSPTPASEVSNRREESHVTDFTELNEDLRSVDSLASHRTAPSHSPATRTSTAAGKKLAPVSHHDVDVSVIPPTPPQSIGKPDKVGEGGASGASGASAASADGDVIVREDASKQHVFAKVVLNSEGEQENKESFTDGASPTKNPKDRTPSDIREEENVRSASVDSTTSTGSEKRHLWAEGKASMLKLKIPKKTSQDEEEEEDVDEANKPADELDRLDVLKRGDVHQEENGRLRTSSDTSNISKGSDSELITKAEAVELRKPRPAPPMSSMSDPGVGNGSRDTLDFKGAASVMNVLRKKAKHEENNNQGRESGQSDSADIARRRWKMVFNVQKFESTVRQAQSDRIPAELLMPSTKDKKKKRRLLDSVPEESGSFMHKFKGDRRGSFDLSKPDIKDQFDENATGVYRTHSEQDILERGLHGATRLWIGKDYVNFIHKDFIDLHNPFEDFIDRTKTPRMPWHDIGAMVYGKAARDISRHFIGRWNYTKLAKYKRKTTFPLLLPKNYPKMSVPQAIKDITFDVETQVLRSLCGWSSGIETPEKSIQEAYEFLIESAKNYIYIENQFFITQVGDSSYVSNCIGNALYKRIIRAYRNDEDFKVYVMMPLLPAFEGEFGTATGVAIQAITHWNFASICRGGNSLLEKLAQSEVPDPNKYIVFCGLRTWDKLDNKLMTELIYIHSKLMIVDDNTVILGSANINDRSMLGKRDSELAIIFRDRKREKIHLNGHYLEPGPFGSSMRHTLFREHLGLTEGKEGMDLRDISCDAFFKNVWVQQAAINTWAFDEVFRCIPTNKVHTFQELNNYNQEPNLATTDPDAAMTHLAKVKGHLVLMPLMFLKDESLTPRMGQKEALLPSYLWT